MSQDYPKCLDMQEYQKKTCTWSLNNQNNQQNPHIEIRNKKQDIYDNILECIGNTPMIRLNNIPKSEDLKCELLAKCEFLNPGGSTKDRIGYRMYQELQRQNKITPETTLIEATSGNTGIGVALVGASKGHKVIITLPEKMSQEKSDTLNALGAKIIRTPTEHPCDHAESHIGVAIKLQKEIPHAIIPDQYVNAGNSLTHYDSTAEEIWEQCGGKVDYVVIAAGTGGVITGVGRKLKEKDGSIKVIGVDPHGSLLATPDELNQKELNKPYKVEGIGYDFIPKNFDRDIADKWYKTYDKESFLWSRRVIKEEGLLVGGSSGSVMAAAMQLAKEVPAGSRIVMVFVDSIRNYMTKFLNDDWMIENGFFDQDVVDKDLTAFGGDDAIKGSLSSFTAVDAVSSKESCASVLGKMTSSGVSCLPVVGDDGLVGVVTKKSVSSRLLSFGLGKNDDIAKAVVKDFKVLRSEQKMKYLSKAFSRWESVVVVDEEKYYIVKADDMLKAMGI